MLNKQPLQVGHIWKRQGIQKTGIDVVGSTDLVQNPKFIFNSFFMNKEFECQENCQEASSMYIFQYFPISGICFNCILYLLPLCH